ncbi:MAG: hypothetical protein CMN77_04660 [Spirochaetaceae bacterium]|nr:hypothetical protein [Spirochaetaceae bacterium]|tara:strand:- start:25518 stop:25937 length:420 start_codon:yes stop_codon:yes gene_type:complete
MEKILHDVLNAGIALFRAGEDSVNNAIKEVQRTFDELKSKGAADNSEPAVQLRKVLDDIVAQANDLNQKTGDAYNQALTQLQDLYNKATVEIEKIVPEERVNEIKDKIEELTNVINSKVNELRGGGASTSGGSSTSTGA